MAAHARLKNEFTEDEKCHNLIHELAQFITTDRLYDNLSYTNIQKYDPLPRSDTILKISMTCS